MLRATALSFICVALATVAAACGSSSSSSGSDADPASLVPAGAPVYAQSVVQPEGARRDDALAAAGKLFRTDDPAGWMRQKIDEALAEEGDGLTWEKDFAPWLGEEAGVWATDLAQDKPTFGVVVASKDADAAKAALQKFKDTGDATFVQREYGGVTYDLDESDGTAVGMVDDFLVIGTEAAFKQSVDLREDGDVLADVDRYKDAVADLGDDTLGHYYVDTPALFELAKQQDPASAQQLDQFKSLFPIDKLGPLTGAFRANGDGMSIDTLVTGVPEGPFRQLAQLYTGGGSELFGELPGDAWAAFATPKLGETAKTMFDTFAGALGGAAVTAQIQKETGLNLQDDIFSWVGDAGVFVRGKTEADVDGALVLQSTDDARAGTAFGKLIGLIGQQAGARPEPVQVPGAESAFRLAVPGAPQPIVLARGEGRVVAAYGEKAAAAALDPETKLGESPLYDDAAGILDDLEPSFVLSVGDAIALADAMGATADPDFAEARPYLESLGAVVSGGSADDDQVQSRFGVTFE